MFYLLAHKGPLIGNKFDSILFDSFFNIQNNLINECELGRHKQIERFLHYFFWGKNEL